MKDDTPSIPFTAMVVTYNEDRRLCACLEGLSFCDQLIVCDLGSEDRSVEVARTCGADVIEHERLPTVEQVRAQIMHHARHDWVVLLDPDEVWDARLTERVRETIRANARVAQIEVPWKFYFKSEPLEGTRWGGEQHKGVIFHQERCDVTEQMYAGVQPHDEFDVATIPWSSGDDAPHIRHYWMDSYQQLFEKHWRYVKRAGATKYQNGHRFGWGDWLYQTAAQFKFCLVHKEGWRDGMRGLFLSAFWAAFQSASMLSLYVHERNVAE